MSDVGPSQTPQKLDAKSVQATTTLQFAINRLNTTQQAFTATQKTYDRSTELLTDQENTLAVIRERLAKLSGSNYTLVSLSLHVSKTITNTLANLVERDQSLALRTHQSHHYHEGADHHPRARLQSYLSSS